MRARDALVGSHYEIVLDLPSDAVLFRQAAKLIRSGTVWIGALEVEVVDATVPTTTP